MMDCAATAAKGETVVLLNYVGGAFTKASKGEELEDLDPASGQLLARCPASSSEDVAAAVNAAQGALEAWAGAGFEARGALLDKVAAMLEERKADFAMMESRDTGKPLHVCASIDIPRAIQNLRFFAGAVRHQSESCHMMGEGAFLNYTQRRPLGLVGLITPWNLPLYLLTWKLGAALAMGNTVIAKPSELTPITAHMLAGLFDAVGAPPGVFNVVSGLGKDVGQAMVEHPSIGMISFTGGTETGRRVALTAAPMFKKLSLELGGKNASIVFADCDFEATVEGVARAAFLNQGQICLCGSRIFVEESLYDKFTAALVSKVRSLKVGVPTDKSCFMSSLISQDHRSKVESYVELSEQEGGSILCGGKRPNDLPESGAYFLPTIIGGLPYSARCATEEIFGPVVTIHRFKTEKEVLDAHDCTPYGLAGSVWTSNLSRGHRMAQKMNTGMVWVNCWLVRDLRVPFGGSKQSGLGREGGWNSLATFSEEKNICVKIGSSL